MTHRWFPATGYDTQPTRRLGDDAISAVISFFLAAFVAGAFAVSSDRFHHWFVIPVLLCGVLAGIDAVDWFRGRVQPFDPVGLIGIYCTFAFFVAPLLHVSWDYWMSYVSPPPDWRDWLGSMAGLNVLGLLAYRTSTKFFSTPVPLGRGTSVWRADPETFRIVSAVALAITGILQVLVYRQWGGISGYIEAFHQQAGTFEGMGWVFMISESFPILLAFAFIVYASRRSRKPTWFTLGLSLVLFFALQMLFGGLRGSRSNTVFRLFWVVGAIHFLVRPVSKRLIFGGVATIIAFMYVYGFYKSHGDLGSLAAGPEERERLTKQTGRSLQAIILGDLGRADVQAYVLYRLVTDPRDFSFTCGRTYLSSATMLIPKWLLPERPAGIVKEGTDILWGPGAYEARVWETSRIFGLAGEAMLNFSPLSVPLAYAVLGFLVSRLRFWINALQRGDLRFLLVPFCVLQCVIAISSDSEQIVFNAISKGFLPCLLVMASATRRHLCGISVPHRGIRTFKENLGGMIARNSNVQQPSR
jgi:hypothetical protein